MNIDSQHYDIPDLLNMGWERFKPEDGHFWLNSQLDRKGPTEVCLGCFIKRPAIKSNA